MHRKTNSGWAANAVPKNIFWSPEISGSNNEKNYLGTYICDNKDTEKLLVFIIK